jgi:hypothetical protein
MSYFSLKIDSFKRDSMLRKIFKGTGHPLFDSFDLLRTYSMPRNVSKGQHILIGPGKSLLIEQISGVVLFRFVFRIFR